MITKPFKAATPVGEIPMILHTPATDKTGVCVVCFHGKSELGNGTLTSLNTLLNNGNNAELLKRGDTYGFSVLAPQVSTNLTGGNPWWNDIQREAIINYALANHTKLPKVGVTGLSQGGGEVWEALTDERTASKIFGAIAICPTSQYGDNLLNKNDFALVAKYGIAVWNFHAVDDGVVGVASSRNMVAKARSYNPDPKVEYTEYTTGGHYVWGRAWGTEAIYPHILSYAPKGGVVVPPLPEPFKPTHKIHRADGGSESVRIETL